MPRYDKREQVGGFRDRRSRKPVSAESDRGKRERTRYTDTRAAQLRDYPYCEPHRAGAPGSCYGGLTVHHVWTLGRSGPRNDRRNTITACAEVNRLMSQDAEVMRWATSRGFLVSADAGPAWLAAGGVQR